MLHAEKVVSGESIRDFPDTSKGTGETDHHDIMDGLPPSGVDLPSVKDGPRKVQSTKQRLIADQTYTQGDDHERNHAGNDSTQHYCYSQSSAA